MKNFASKISQPNEKTKKEGRIAGFRGQAGVVADFASSPGVSSWPYLLVIF